MVRVYIDFDGTITVKDVGDALFERFGGAESTASIEAYRREEISAAECFRRECAACGTVDPGELNRFLDGQQIDPTFPAFIAFCESSGVEAVILSDGMDYYIDRILRRHGVGSVKRFSNHLEIVPEADGSGVRFVPGFPFTDEVCTRCACCKRNHILTLSADEDLIVYVGEGYSDRCPARFADIVFAKDDLLNYCRRENISYFEYTTFASVQERLRDVVATDGRRKNVRKRHRAELARRNVYLGG
ncbi:MAG TPA: MtnX-like HAD-IB family phosphatase [Bacteroidota bacterium]|nr:MtnX-like HAD-IB family phosphatase [Bacteroidota bacterium]